MMAGPFDRVDVALRALRAKKGWTLEEVGRRAKVDPGNLSRYENGETLPTLHVLGRLLMAYGASVHDFADLLAASGEANKGGAGVGARAAGEEVDPFVEAVAGALRRLGIRRPGEEGTG
jgi:transcriptional regulator with XRE-family HTH domain